jgi:hypothetical protein
VVKITHSKNLPRNLGLSKEADLTGGRRREPSQHTFDLHVPPFSFAGRARDTAFNAFAMPSATLRRPPAGP